MIRKILNSGIWFLEKLDFVPFIITRLIIGVLFVMAGWGKINNLDNTIQFFQSIHIPFPQYQAPFVAVVELVGGLMVLLGIGARIAVIPLMATMVVALVTAKRAEIGGWADLLSISDFLYIPMMLFILFRGAGFPSFDQIIRKGLLK